MIAAAAAYTHKVITLDSDLTSERSRTGQKVETETVYAGTDTVKNRPDGFKTKIKNPTASARR